MSGKLIPINPTMRMKSNSDFKPDFTMKVKDKKAEIIIYSAIGEDYWGDGSYTSARDFVKKLGELPNDITEIELRLNSPGGSVFDGITIYERLKQHKAKITVYVDALAASIASIIALAGDEVIIAQGGFFMLHQPMTGVYGNTTDMEKVIAVLDKIERQMVGIYVDRTNVSQAKILEMITGKDTWLNAEEAVEMGFAHKIAESGTEMSAVASVMGAFPELGVPLDIIENVKSEVEKQTVSASQKGKLDKFLARFNA